MTVHTGFVASTCDGTKICTNRHVSRAKDMLSERAATKYFRRSKATPNPYATMPQCLQPMPPVARQQLSGKACDEAYPLHEKSLVWQRSASSH